MKIRYDTEVDALYIRQIMEEQECRTMRLSDEVALNVGPEETPVSRYRVSKDLGEWKIFHSSHRATLWLPLNPDGSPSVKHCQTNVARHELLQYQLSAEENNHV